MIQKKQTPQTAAARVEVLRDYFTNDFPRCFPHLEQILDASGKVLCRPSYAIMFNQIRGLEFVRKDLINEILLDLDSKELLVRKGPERIVEVEKQPDPKIEARKKFEAARDMGLLNSPKHNRNELDDQFDHGKARALPLTENERVALNERNRRIDAVIADTMSSIGNYSGPSHARTYSRRDELTALFNQHKSKVNDVESAEKLQRTIAEKINSYDRSTSGSIR